jgi:hypothetical protein
MLKLTVNKSKCTLDIKANDKQAIGEAIMANIHLTQVIADNMGMTYEAAAMFLFQQGTIAYKQAIDDINRTDDK